MEPLIGTTGALRVGLGMLAGATGLEPAVSCVTGRRSNQLNYAPAKLITDDLQYYVVLL